MSTEARVARTLLSASRRHSSCRLARTGVSALHTCRQDAGATSLLPSGGSLRPSSVPQSSL